MRKFPMDLPTPLVAPALLWTAVAAASLITSIALSVRAKRRQTASDAWNPIDTDFPVIAVGAISNFTMHHARWANYEGPCKVRLQQSNTDQQMSLRSRWSSSTSSRIASGS